MLVLPVIPFAVIKKIDTTANSILNSVIDSINTSLQCSKYDQVVDRVGICIPDNVGFKKQENREIAKKGFGACLIRAYDFGGWEASIIIDMENCTRANLTEREIAAVIFHELGHLLNEPELQNEPTFEFCFIHGIQFSRELLEQVKDSNSLAIEIFADSYASEHGYRDELISTFHKQNKYFEQQIGYCTIRIEKLQENQRFEGKILSVNNNGR